MRDAYSIPSHPESWNKGEENVYQLKPRLQRAHRVPSIREVRAIRALHRAAGTFLPVRPLCLIPFFGHSPQRVHALCRCVHISRIRAEPFASAFHIFYAVLCNDFLGARIRNEEAKEGRLFLFEFPKCARDRGCDVCILYIYIVYKIGHDSRFVLLCEAGVELDVYIQTYSEMNAACMFFGFCSDP